MLLRRLAQTASSVVAVAFCADTVTHPKFQRQKSTPEQQTTLRSQAFSTASQAHKLYADTDWKHYQTSKDVKVSYKNSSDQNGDVYRIDMTVESPLDTVVSVLMNLNEREQWDPDVDEYIIEDLTEGVAILHTTYKTSGLVAKLVSPRDFCRIEMLNKHKDGSVSSTYNNVDHPGCKSLDGFVRGQLHPSGLFCSPCKEDSNKTQIIFIYQSDAKVYIPGYILRITNCNKAFEMAGEIKATTERAAKQSKNPNADMVRDIIWSSQLLQEDVDIAR